ncbi:MAG TPA: polyphosphate kinase 1 [Armatimonadota bacterium]|nr:polyphosphate kinase 1 [Armatimonadota bacterium]
MSAHHKHDTKKHRVVQPTDSLPFVNRQISWLQFNHRVLEQAADTRNPLLERVKFLAISANNLDEFFMVRISGVRRQLAAGVTAAVWEGVSADETMTRIRHDVQRMLEEQYHLWHDDLLPSLRSAGIHILDKRELSVQQQAQLRELFTREIYPVLTPFALDSAHPFPHISSLSLNLAVVVEDPHQGKLFARVKVPEVFPRLLPLPGQDDQHTAQNQPISLVWLEDVITANLDMLFPGLQICAAYTFRITRDADVTVDEDDSDDLLKTVEASLELREYGSENRLEIDRCMPQDIRELLVQKLAIAPDLLFTVDGPLGMGNLMSLAATNRPELRYEPFVPALSRALQHGGSIFQTLQNRDILLYHPYQSFLPVVEFMREAARDPDVLAIKQTLYRVGEKSPIVDALIEARERGKQVAVLVEVKARFDEEKNIGWARALEQAGVHVVYGVLGLKTHAKMCLVVRREHDKIRRYVHLGTGNYNTVTSRVYADFSILTSDSAIGEDVADLFNALTGYSRRDTYRKLLAAPGKLREEIIRRIRREITRQREHGDGYLALKMNALADQECIRILYEASQAGVEIDLQIRGICCLRPGIPGLSEHITVTSIVGRFLEHSRIYYFRNGGDEEVLLGSADLMTRNLDHRVDVVFPVEDQHLREILVHDILLRHLRDTTHAWQLLPDGSYTRRDASRETKAIDSQHWMLRHAAELF